MIPVECMDPIAVDLMNQFVPLGIGPMDHFRPYLGSIRIALTSSLQNRSPDQRPVKISTFTTTSTTAPYSIRIPAFRLEAQPF